jgi:chromosome segregation ATPase
VPLHRWLYGRSSSLFRIDLEVSAARAKLRRVDDSIRSLDEEVGRVGREAAEVQLDLKRLNDESEGRMQVLEREVQAAVDREPGALAPSQLHRKINEWRACNEARLAEWTARNAACKQRFEAVDRKRKRIRLDLDKIRYYHGRLRIVPPIAGRAAGGPAADASADDDSD